MAKATTSDPLDPLYTAPLAEFVATRNRLAAELRKSGDKEGSAAVKAAAKPSASAWGVNQAVRRDPQALRALLAASDALRKAQLEGAGGQGREKYQRAVAEHRQAMDAVADQAMQALKEAGTTASAAVRERVAGNLRWGPQARDTRALLESGRLTHDVGPQDFEALARMAVGGDVDDEGHGGKVIPIGRSAPRSPSRTGKKPAPPAAAASREDPASGKAAREAAAHQEREAARRRREQIAELKTQQRTRRQEADRAAKARGAAAAEVAGHQKRLAELEAELTDTRTALETARRDERRAGEAMMRAETAAHDAARALAEAEGE